MSTAHSIHGDQIWRVLEERQAQELRFRSAVITSTALHTGVTLAVLLVPMFLPRPQLFAFTPVNVVQLQAPQPQPTATPPPPAEEQQPAEEPAAPEPEPEPPTPQDVPADLEAQRIAEEEAAARRRAEEAAERQRLAEEAERKRLADEARQRREAEAEAERRRQQEEAERAKPQAASRLSNEAQAPQEITQQASRGQVGMQLEPGMTQQDLNYLSFWIDRVLISIGNKWDPLARPAGSRQLTATIHFRVDRNGRIIEGPEVRATSSDRRYDDAALRAVQGGQPFPPLPQAYRGGTLAINLEFRQE